MIILPTIKDIDKMLDLWETAVDELYPMMSQDRLQYARNALAGELHLLPILRILKNEKGRIVALIKVNDGVIDFLYVHPSERRKGYALQLIKYALEHMGAKEAVIHRPKSYLISFYETAGFKREKECGQKVYFSYGSLPA